MNENLETDSFCTDASMASPAKLNFGSAKKLKNYSYSNSNMMNLNKGMYLVKKRVDENDSKYSNIVKNVRTFE